MRGGREDGGGKVNRLSRRRVLELFALAGGAQIVAGCAAPPAAPAATAPAPLAPKKPATLEEELALPDAVLEAARREGKMAFIASVGRKQLAKAFEAFEKRYPGIEPQYQEANEEVRTVRTLTEFKAGRNRIDVVLGIGGFLAEYREANALSPLNDLPAYAVYEPPYRDPGNGWAGVRTQFWGIGYNTEKVKVADLPKRWEDLVDTRWRERIGLGDRPQLWVQQLWKVWGAERTTDLLKKLFANKPQRRKEGLDAAVNLLGAGEFDLFIPSGVHRINDFRERGVPVAWSSPEPLSVAVSELVALPGSPNRNAAKVFVNWLISREGQAAFVAIDRSVPAHPALRSDRQYLGAFVDAIVGRQVSVRVPEDEIKVLPEVRKVWRELWTG